MMTESFLSTRAGRLSIFLILSFISSNLVQGLNLKRATSLADILSSRKLPGIAALAVRSNGTLEDGVAGVRKQGNDTLITTDDKFHLGSNTKAMTATLLAVIIENGNSTLNWNSTLAEALPRFQNMSSGYQNVTLAMVGAHRSGIVGDFQTRNITLAIQLFDSKLDPVTGRSVMVEQVLRLEPDFTPNTSSNYTNLNYILLGHVIDQYGTPWEDAIKSMLWDPLDMDGCGFGPSPQSSPGAIDNPWPHQPSDSGPVPLSPFSQNPPADNAPSYNPAGRVHCTMESYSKFLALHLSALEGRNTGLIPLSAFDILHTPYPITDREPQTGRYTSGAWVADTFESYGGQYLWHIGSNTLNYAYSVLAPTRNVSVSVLTNVGGPQAELGCVDGANSWFSGGLTLKEASSDNGTKSGSGSSSNGAGNELRTNFGLVVWLAIAVAGIFCW